MFEAPQVKARELLVPVEDEQLGDVLGPGVVPKLSRTPGRSRFTASRTPGADNDKVLGQLVGFDEDERRGLSDRGVI